MWPEQAERPEGGAERPRAGVPAPTWTPAGPGPTPLICLASQTLQLFPLFCPLAAQRKSRGGVPRGAGFPLGICVFFFKKASKPGKAWDKPS